MNIETRSALADMQTIIGQEVARAERTGLDYRTESTYRRVFNYSDDYRELAGKSVLSLGEGDNNFARTVGDLGIAKRVIALDPKYGVAPNDYQPHKRRIPPEFPQNPLAGCAQNLPFRDKIFDETVALWVFHWIRNFKEEALQELMRITKVGGKIQIHPVFPDYHLYGGKPTKHSYIFNPWSANKTLVIHKTSDITEETCAQEARQIVKSVGFIAFRY